MGRPKCARTTKAYSSVTRKKILTAVIDVNYLLPRRMPYNGGIEKNLIKAHLLLEQIEASLINYEWVTKKKLNETKKGN
jgi:hypothetical protein